MACPATVTIDEQYFYHFQLKGWLSRLNFDEATAAGFIRDYINPTDFYLIIIMTFVIGRGEESTLLNTNIINITFR